MKKTPTVDPVAAPVKLDAADYWNVQALMGRATTAQRQAQDAAAAAQQSLTVLTDRLVALKVIEKDQQITAFNSDDATCAIAVQVV